MLLMANLLDLARHSFAIHRRRRRGGADYDGSHFIDVHAHFLALGKSSTIRMDGTIGRSSADA